MINRRDFFRTVTGTTAGMLLCESAWGLQGPSAAQRAMVAAAAQGQAGRKPNVVLIVSDNQRPDTIGALGNPHIHTPNLDALARRGCAFDNAYFMGSTMAATCMPSRTMLMTGLSLFHAPLRQVSEEEEATRPPIDVPILPKTMKEAGYQTLRTGKFGNYPRFAGNEFHHNIVVGRSRNGSERHANNAIDFVKRQQNADDPFFLYVAFAAPNDPHTGPGTAPQEFRDMYKPGDVPLPPNYLPMHPFDNGEMIIRDELLAPWPRTPEVIQEHLAGFYAVISYMDQQIGRILSALDETGQRDNTIVIFASDTGTAIGSHGLIGMQNLYEHSTGVPMIFSGPGIPQGQRSNALAYLYDMFPTICDLTGVAIPEDVEGKSLAPVMRGETRRVRDSLLTAYRDVQRAVRDERWKLIRYPYVRKTQLFDLENDPHEMHNLADDPAHADKLKEMMALMRRAQERAGDSAPLTVS